MFKEMSRVGPRQPIEPVSFGVSLGDIGSVRRPVIYKKYKQERLRVSQQQSEIRAERPRPAGTVCDNADHKSRARLGAASNLLKRTVHGEVLLVFIPPCELILYIKPLKFKFSSTMNSGNFFLLPWGRYSSLV